MRYNIFLQNFGPEKVKKETTLEKIIKMDLKEEDVTVSAELMWFNRWLS
jgi:hypothetical protein